MASPPRNTFMYAPPSTYCPLEVPQKRKPAAIQLGLRDGESVSHSRRKLTVVPKPAKLPVRKPVIVPVPKPVRVVRKPAVVVEEDSEEDDDDDFESDDDDEEESEVKPKNKKVLGRPHGTRTKPPAHASVARLLPGANPPSLGTAAFSDPALPFIVSLLNPANVPMWKRVLYAKGGVLPMSSVKCGTVRVICIDLLSEVAQFVQSAFGVLTKDHLTFALLRLQALRVTECPSELTIRTVFSVSLFSLDEDFVTALIKCYAPLDEVKLNDSLDKKHQNRYARHPFSNVPGWSYYPDRFLAQHERLEVFSKLFDKSGEFKLLEHTTGWPLVVVGENFDGKNFFGSVVWDLLGEQRDRADVSMSTANSNFFVNFTATLTPERNIPMTAELLKSCLIVNVKKKCLSFPFIPDTMQVEYDYQRRVENKVK